MIIMLLQTLTKFIPEKPSILAMLKLQMRNLDSLKESETLKFNRK